jgi:hypothetical protein
MPGKIILTIRVDAQNARAMDRLADRGMFLDNSYIETIF